MAIMGLFVFPGHYLGADHPCHKVVFVLKMIIECRSFNLGFFADFSYPDFIGKIDYSKVEKPKNKKIKVMEQSIRRRLEGFRHFHFCNVILGKGQIEKMVKYGYNENVGIQHDGYLIEVGNNEYTRLHHSFRKNRRLQRS